ncbi:transposable element Tcb1 transposase [Trichonephila clavipes]|nr:transposable element Tcb1 transposase [Trichonephila clavipes]
MPRGRHRESFDQVSEFDRGRMVAYRDCGFSPREISQSFGRNEATDNVGPHVVLNIQEFFFTHRIEFILLPVCSPDLSRENVWSMFVQRLAWDTSPAATPEELWQYVEAAWTAVPEGYIQNLFDSMPSGYSQQWQLH